MVGEARTVEAERCYRDYPRVTHEFFGVGTLVAKAKQADEVIVEHLEKAFAGASSQ